MSNFTRRAWLAGAGIGAITLGTVGLVVRAQTTALTLTERLAMLLFGLALGCLAGVLASYILHSATTRRLLIPWGTAGGFVALLVGALSAGGDSVKLWRFSVIALVATLAVACGTRLLIEAFLGPLSDRPYWAEAVDDGEPVSGLATAPRG